MNLLKRALASICSNKGKTLLHFVILFVAMFTITMNNIVEVTYSKLLREAFPEGDVPVYVEPQNPRTMTNQMTYNWEKFNSVTPEMYDEMAKSELVSSIEKEMGLYLFTSFEPVSGVDENSLSIEFSDGLKLLGEQAGLEFKYDQNQYYNEKRPIVLNEEFLSVNNFAVGDTIMLDLSDYIYSKDGEVIEVDELKAMEYTIVGSYHFEPTPEMIDKAYQHALESDTGANFNFDHERIRAFMPVKNAEELIKIAEDNDADPTQIVYTTCTIYLKDLSNLSAFKKEARAITGFDIDVDVSLYAANDVTGFMELDSIIMLSNAVQRFFTVTLSVGFTILIIIEIIYTYAHRKDIGIKLSHGESRKSIYFQIVLEQIIIMIISVLAAFPVATFEAHRFGMYSDVQLPFVISPLFLSMLAGLIIVLVSTSIPAIYTLCINPDKVK